MWLFILCIIFQLVTACFVNISNCYEFKEITLVHIICYLLTPLTVVVWVWFLPEEVVYLVCIVPHAWQDMSVKVGVLEEVHRLKDWVMVGQWWPTNLRISQTTNPIFLCKIEKPLINSVINTKSISVFIRWWCWVSSWLHSFGFHNWRSQPLS